MSENEVIPTSDLRSIFYMREVNRHFNYWGYYPDYFLCELIKCDFCGGYFSEKNMYRFRQTWHRLTNRRSYDNKCKLCQQRYYFRCLAKVKIYRETGLLSAKQPEDLVNEVAMFLLERRTLLEIKSIIRKMTKVSKEKKQLNEKQA